MKLAVALCLLAVASALTPEEKMFSEFVGRYNKVYDCPMSFFQRFSVFKDNLAFVRNENAKNLSYTLAVNEFADLTNLEFMNLYAGLMEQPSGLPRSEHVSAKQAPTAAVDWRAKGAVTPIKNQGQCGSCWAFSTTGSVEGAYQIKSGQLVSLSEQQLVDCAGSSGNQGCNGGFMDYAFEWIMKNGICSEKDYPYTGRDGTCKKTCKPVTKVTGYKDVTAGSETDLLNAVTTTPVSVAIEADQSAFQFYRSGVFTAACGRQLDHGVLAVGYGTQGTQDYWIVKNSWGVSWGEQGYIRMIRNKDQCGIADAASYPTI